MREPFVRPFLALIFNGVAGICAVLAVSIIPILLCGGGWYFGIKGPYYSVVMGLGPSVVCLVLGGFFGVAGFHIEKLAKIEWNTRPHDEPLH